MGCQILKLIVLLSVPAQGGKDAASVSALGGIGRDWAHKCTGWHWQGVWDTLGRLHIAGWLARAWYKLTG